MKQLTLTVFLLLAAFLGKAQQNEVISSANEGGYLISGDTLLFVFDPKLYTLTTQEMGGMKNLNKLKMKEVFVSGTFNDWEKANKSYKLALQEDGTYTLAVNLTEARKSKPVVYYYNGKKYSSGNERTSPNEIEFKFVINGEYWVEPARQFTNVVNSGEWDGPLNFIIKLKD